MYKYIKKNSFQNIMLIIITCMWAGINVFSSIVLSWLLDSLTSKSWKMFILWAVVDIFCWLIYSFFQMIKDTYKEKIIQKQLNDIRSDLLNEISSLSHLEFSTRVYSEYQSWLINDMNLLRENGFLQIYAAVESVITIILNSVAIIYFHWSLLLFTILLTFFVYISPKFFQKRIDTITSNLSDNLSFTLDRVEDYFKGYNIFYFHGKLQYFRKEILSFFEKQISSRIELTMYSSLANAISMVASIISQVILFIVSGYLIIKSIVSVGVIFSIANLSSSIFNYTRGAAYNIVTAKAANKILNKYPNEKHHSDIRKLKQIEKFNDSILFNNVRVKFSNGHFISFPNLKINKGEKIAVVGESGAGKSTLIKLLLGVVSPYDGEILIDGIRYEDIDHESKITLFNYLEQKPYLLKENLSMNLFIDKSTTIDFNNNLFRNSAFDFIKHHLDDEDTRNLSEGQKSRVALLRELLDEKDILLVDEGTASLDYKNSIEVERLILNIPDKTVIFVTHVLHEDTSNLFDKIIRMESK